MWVAKKEAMKKKVVMKKVLESLLYGITFRSYFNIGLTDFLGKHNSALRRRTDLLWTSRTDGITLATFLEVRTVSGGQLWVTFDGAFLLLILVFYTAIYLKVIN